MKGKILGADESGGTISGEDGRRYKFEFSQWKSDRPPVPGGGVDFATAGDGQAEDVFTIGGGSPLNFPVAQNGDGMTLGIASLVLGILGFVPFIGLLCAIGGLVTGLIARGQARAFGNGRAALLALIGLILSGVMLALTLFALMLGGGMLLAGLSTLMGH